MTLPVPVPAGAPPDSLSFGEMYRRAEVLAKTDLVPTPLQGKPEAIVVIGVWGAEHGVPLMTAIQEVHVIENRPSPSAQLRLALIRRAGHEIRFQESNSTRAVLQARRREWRNDPDAWVTVTYTIDDARRAGLLDRWVERWMKPPGSSRDKKHVWKVGDDTGNTGLDGAPDWVAEEVRAGRIRSKDNWQKYPADMLRARAASVMSRMEFSDVLAALSVEHYTAEELGVDVGQDLDETLGEAPATTGDDRHPSEGDGDAEEEVEDAVVVEDQQPPGPEDQPSADRPPPAPSGPTEPPPPWQMVPHPVEGERPDVTVLRARLNLLDPAGKRAMRAWFDERGIDWQSQGSNDIDQATVKLINDKLDRMGAAKVETRGYEGLLPPET